MRAGAVLLTRHKMRCLKLALTTADKRALTAQLKGQRESVAPTYLRCRRKSVLIDCSIE